MSRPRWTLHVRVDRHVIGIRGWQARELLEAGGFRPVWLGTTREQTLDRRHAADVIALLQHSGAALAVTGEDVTREVVARRAESAGEDQLALDLFGGDAA